MQTNLPMTNHTSYNHGPSNTNGPASSRPQHPSGKNPPRSRGLVPQHRNSASLEGRTPPQAKLRLARGLDAPAGDTPPRSRAMRTLVRDSASLEARVGPPPQARDPAPTPSTRALNDLAHRAPRSRANPRHAGPLTPPGNPTPALFHRPPALCGHPRHCTTPCSKASVNSVTLCHLLPYGRRATPSKEGDGTLEKGIDTCPTPTRDNAVTSDQWSVSPPSPLAQCSHPHRCATIPGPVRPSPAPWEPGTTRHCHGRSCAPHGLPSAAPSSQRTDGDQTGSSHTATLEAAPGREQDLP
jgi:hypothetical protein